MIDLLVRLFNWTPRDPRTWTEEVNVEVPPTPVTRYVAAMLIQMSKSEPQTRILNRSGSLPALTIGVHTAEPSPVGAVVRHLKDMCNVEPGSNSTPVEGSVRCSIQGPSFDLKCHFDDNAEACCWIRVEKSDETEEAPAFENLQNNSHEAHEPRVIRYGTPEYREFMRHKTRVPWHERIRRSAILALICACLVLAALIVDCVIFGQTQWPVMKMIPIVLFAGVFIFVMMLFAYALQDILR